MIRILSLVHLPGKQLVIDSTLVLFNITAWAAVLVKWADVSNLTSVVATLAATGVSVTTVLWIREQTKSLARTEAEQLERHTQQVASWAETRRQGILLDQNASIIKSIPQMQADMKSEHNLNIDIREVSRETLRRSPSVSDQAEEHGKVMASREEVRRVGKVVDVAAGLDHAVAEAAAAAVEAAAAATAATAVTAAATTKAAATAAAAAVAATAVATAITVAAAAADAARAATNAVATAAEAATAAVAAAAECAATAVAVAAAAGLPKKP